MAVSKSRVRGLNSLLNIVFQLATRVSLAAPVFLVGVNAIDPLRTVSVNEAPEIEPGVRKSRGDDVAWGNRSW